MHKRYVLLRFNSFVLERGEEESIIGFIVCELFAAYGLFEIGFCTFNTCNKITQTNRLLTVLKIYLMKDKHHSNSGELVITH